MQSHRSETANRVLISAADLADNFDTGLKDFQTLLHSAGSDEKDRLIDLLESQITEIAAARR